MLGKIEGRRRRGCQRLRWLNGITDAMDMNLGKLWEMIERPGMLQSMGSKRVRHNWVTEHNSQAWNSAAGNIDDTPCSPCKP